MTQASGAGFNPYRKANGEFASPNEVNESFEKQISAHSAAGETEQAGKVQQQYDDYVMDKQPESDRAQELFKQKYGNGTVQKQGGGSISASALEGRISTNTTIAQRKLILSKRSSRAERNAPEVHELRVAKSGKLAEGKKKQQLSAIASLKS